MKQSDHEVKGRESYSTKPARRLPFQIVLDVSTSTVSFFSQQKKKRLALKIANRQSLGFLNKFLSFFKGKGSRYTNQSISFGWKILEYKLLKTTRGKMLPYSTGNSCGIARDVICAHRWRHIPWCENAFSTQRLFNFDMLLRSV